MYVIDYLFAPGPPPRAPPPKPAPPPPPPRLDEANERLRKLLESDETKRSDLASKVTATLASASRMPLGSMQRRSEEARAVDLYRQLQQVERQVAALRQKIDAVGGVQRMIAQSEVDAAVAHAVQAASEQMADVPDVSAAMRDLEERTEIMQRSFAPPVGCDDREIDEEIARLRSEGYDQQLPSVPAEPTPAAPDRIAVHSK